MQDDFFAVHEQSELALPPPRRPGDGAQSLGQPHSIYGLYSSSPSTFSLSRMVSRISILSIFSRDTFLSSNSDRVDQTISLRTLLDVIKRHRSLQEARIIQVDSYRNYGPAHHRFIVLQLEREGREQIWLRIDRRRDKRRSVLNFTIDAGTSPANDRVSRCRHIYLWPSIKDFQAWFSADKRVISEGLNPEHTLSFNGVVPTLGDLRWVFFAIIQVLERYELFRVRA